MHAFSSATEGEPVYLRYPIPEKRDRLSTSMYQMTFVLCVAKGKDKVTNRPATGGIVQCHHSLNVYFQEWVGMRSRILQRGQVVSNVAGKQISPQSCMVIVLRL
jgi:hypothetical protein